jgi:glycosyltransferase involved in cell wall biosynthesis
MWRVFEHTGHRVSLMSRFRSLDIQGDPKRQRQLAKDAGLEAERLSEQLLTATAGEQPDLWFSYHLYHKAPDWIGPSVTTRLGIPYVVAEASYAPSQENGPWDIGLRQTAKALSQARGVLSLNPRDLKCIQGLLNPDARQLLLKPFLVDALPSDRPHRERRAKLAKHYGLAVDQPWLIAVAMMRTGDKSRSYSMLAQSLSLTEDLPWQIILVGDGPARTEIEKAFASVAQQRVCFCGQLDPLATADLLAAADLFTWPAMNEAFGMAILEAHRHGLPVVAGYTDGVASLVNDGQTGLLTRPPEPVVFASSIRKLLEDADLRRKMSLNARDKFLKQHDFDAAASRIHQFLLQMQP